MCAPSRPKIPAPTKQEKEAQASARRVQREALQEKWGTVKRMIKALPEHQKKDTINMLRKTNNDPLIGKKFPSDEWFFQGEMAHG